jgi:H+/Cl- antiporter ClcA
VAVGVLALVFAVITHKGITPVLFSGQSYLGTLVGHAATWSVGALLVLMVCKGLAYGISLSSFRGGPVFPSLLLGAAIGLVFSHLPGMSIVPAIAAGIGGMGAAMLRLPLASAMLAILLLAQDALAVSPIVIVSVVAAYVLGAWIAPKPAAPPPAPSPATTPSPAPAGG